MGVQTSHRYTVDGIEERQLLLILWHIDRHGDAVNGLN
jgi:hypothetical protein